MGYHSELYYRNFEHPALGAEAYGLSLDAVKNWETGRSVPDRSATTLLTVIERDPKAVIKALRQEDGKKTRKIA